MTTIDQEPDEDWTELAEALQDANIDAQKAVSAATDGPPDLEMPTDGPVRLPGGFKRYNGTEPSEEVREAWVRELTGVDEERIAKARIKGGVKDVVDAVLEGGIERLGSQPPLPGEILDMISGDREFLLLEISKVTFGDALEYEQVVCPRCRESFGMTLSKGDDIPIKRLDSIEDGFFDVPLRRGDVASVRLMTGREQRLILDGNRTPAEVNTALLSKCVLTITKKDGTEVDVGDDPEAVRNMGSVDREKILLEVADRTPGPKYNEVKFKHEPGCGFDISFSIGLMELFRSL